VVPIAAPSAAPAPIESAPIAKPEPPPPRGRALEGYPAPLDPNGTGCVLTGAWAQQQPNELRFSPSGKPWAIFHRPVRGSVTLVEKLHEGSPAAFAELSSDSVRVWGFVATDKLFVRSAVPFAAAGFALPAPNATMQWLGSKEGLVSVEVKLPAHAKALVPPRAERACGELALDPAQYDARAAIPEPKLQSMQLPDARTIQLTDAPGGKAVCELKYPLNHHASVDVIARSGNYARILVHAQSLGPTDSVVFAGWVQSSLLSAPNSGSSGSWGTGRGSWASTHRPRRRVTCPQEVPIVADLGGESKLVGAVLPNVTIEITGPDEGEWVEVHLRTAQVQPAEGAKTMVKRSVVAPCPDVH
jgi:hypothetical protein